VLDCSTEAMSRGVLPGMSLREALSRCADASFVEAHSDWYEATTMAMVDALLEISPFVEPASPGVIYVGVDRSCESFWGHVPHAPSQGSDRSPQPLVETRNAELEALLARAIMAAAERASGLIVQVGLADGKFAAYVAARAGAGQKRPTFSRLSIEDLPVSTEARRRLRLFGIQTVGEFSRLPRSAVTAQFGAEGARAWELAHGIDREPIISYRPPLTITERLAFPAPVEMVGLLLIAVRTLLGRAWHRPQSRGRGARGVRLLVHLEGGHTWERRMSFREPVGSAERMLVALKPRIEGATLSAPFTEVVLSLVGLCGESALQGNLFISERGRQLARVAEAARQLKARYGRPILAKVVEVEPWSRIPERRFALIDYDP